MGKIAKDKHFIGKVQIKMATEVRTPYLLRRPTGIPSLDMALGGGLHAGGAVEIHGEESVGKTHDAYRVAGEVQKIYGAQSKILIYAIEIRPDKTYARKSGFCIGYSPKEIEEYEAIRHARGIPPFTDEEKADLMMQIGEVVVVVASTADAGLDIVVSALETGMFQLMIIESLGSFLTPEADDKDIGDRNSPGGSAVIVTNFQNKVYPLYMMDRPDGSMLETTIIGVNQARANLDAGMYGIKTKAAMGAHSWKHGQLASIRLEKGAKIKEVKDGPVKGNEIRWTLTKGKAGTHDGLFGRYNYYHVGGPDPILWSTVQNNWIGGIDVNRDLINLAASDEYGLIKKSGSWLVYAGERVQGMDEFAALLLKNPDLRDMIWKDCIEAKNLVVRYK